MMASILPPLIPLCVQGARPKPPCDPSSPRPPQPRGMKMLVSTAGMGGMSLQRCGAACPDTCGAAAPGGHPLVPLRDSGTRGVAAARVGSGRVQEVSHGSPVLPPRRALLPGCAASSIQRGHAAEPGATPVLRFQVRVFFVLVCAAALSVFYVLLCREAVGQRGGSAYTAPAALNLQGYSRVPDGKVGPWGGLVPCASFFPILGADGAYPRSRCAELRAAAAPSSPARGRCWDRTWAGRSTGRSACCA